MKSFFQFLNVYVMTIVFHLTPFRWKLVNQKLVQKLSETFPKSDVRNKNWIEQEILYFPKSVQKVVLSWKGCGMFFSKIAKNWQKMPSWSINIFYVSIQRRRYKILQLAKKIPRFFRKYLFFPGKMSITTNYQIDL